MCQTPLLPAGRLKGFALPLAVLTERGDAGAWHTGKSFRSISMRHYTPPWMGCGSGLGAPHAQR
eukprot:11379278-Karenia_brevis.AAC.1